MSLRMLEKVKEGACCSKAKELILRGANFSEILSIDLAMIKNCIIKFGSIALVSISNI